MTTLTLTEINNLDIVDFLDSIGYQPVKVRGYNYWYLSMLPDRFEKTASFKVNRKLNRWKDFGNGEGSTLVDFGIKYYNCTIRELVLKLSGQSMTLQNVPHHHVPPADEPDPRLTIADIHPLRSLALTRYLWDRRILLDVAQKYCVEAHYKVGIREFYAIGFKSDAGGYELRNRYFKGSSSPKSHTFIDNGSANVAMTEGFFDLLTLISFFPCPDEDLPNLLILNSTAFFPRALDILKRHRRTQSFLDNDKEGDRCTALGQKEVPGFLDHRPLYSGYKDLNLWACSVGKATIPLLQADPLPGGGWP